MQETAGQRVSERDIVEYVLERFADVKDGNKIRDLVSFQAMNKFMIMAHDQGRLRIMGNLVASYKKVTLQEITEEYERHLRLALEKTPTTGSHANVVMHVFGHFSKNLNRLEKSEFLKLVGRFREEEVTLGNMLAEINPVIYRFNSTYLASQTYFLLYADAQPGNLFEILSHRQDAKRNPPGSSGSPAS